MRNNHSRCVLNKILTEMDGFKNNDNVLVLASTNRVEDLDKALLRSGRFDSKIYINKPSRDEQHEIFKLYLDKINLNSKLDKNQLIETLLSKVDNITGADIYNICNRASILATYNHSEHVEENDIYNSIDDILIGIKDDSCDLQDEEKERVAYHESGHALISYLLENTNSPTKISLYPRGGKMLGYTQPKIDTFKLKTQKDYIDNICVLVAGRIGEEIKFEYGSIGGSDDFNKATQIATTMISYFGMSTEFGLINYSLKRSDDNHISDKTRYDIEKASQKIIELCYLATKTILKKYTDQLEKLTSELLSRKELFYEDIIKIIGKNLEDSENMNNVYNNY